MPLLALAVTQAEKYSTNTAKFVKMLLAFGVDPLVIPREMWDAYIKMPEDAVAATSSPTPAAASWCHLCFRDALVRNLNLTQRYFPFKVAEIDPPCTRMMPVAEAHGITALLQAPYFLIGQEFGTSEAFESITRHVALRKKRPMVMVFAGLSGYGKTELALNMKNLLSVEHVVIGCSEVRYETDLFGPKTPYQGYENGSPLNNHQTTSVVKPDVVISSSLTSLKSLYLSSGRFFCLCLRVVRVTLDQVKHFWLTA